MPFKANITARLILCALACFFQARAVLADEVVSGEFELFDHNGNLVNQHSYDGQLRLVFFGFTQCPDICPTTMFEIRGAMKKLGDDASNVQPLFISIDRENDTLERIASYVGAFDPDFVGLSGTEAQIDAAADAFNVTYGVQSGDESLTGDETIFHSAYLFLMDRQGKFLDVFGYGTKADVIAEKIRKYL